MPTSDSHRIAVMKQDDGELQEDVMERGLAETGGPASGEAAQGADLQPAAEADRRSVESFPASDAPSSWAGPPDAPTTPRRGPPSRGIACRGSEVPREDLAEDPAGSARPVFGSDPAPEVPERAHPADPVPGTLRTAASDTVADPPHPLP